MYVCAFLKRFSITVPRGVHRQVLVRGVEQGVGGSAQIPAAFTYPLIALAVRSGWFAEGRFLGKVLDEWITDTQEFIRLKLPHLIVAAAIGFALYRVLSIITSSHGPHRRSARGRA